MLERYRKAREADFEKMGKFLDEAIGIKKSIDFAAQQDLNYIVIR